MSDIEIIRALLDDARLEHKAACGTDPCPAADRWGHEASDALDRIQSQIEALCREKRALASAYARLAERLRLATPHSLMALTDEATP